MKLLQKIKCWFGYHEYNAKIFCHFEIERIESVCQMSKAPESAIDYFCKHCGRRR